MSDPQTAPYGSVRVADVDTLAQVDPGNPDINDCDFHLVRRHFNVQAFGVNAATGNAGDEMIEDHHEADDEENQTNGHQELFTVMTGHAVFTVDGSEDPWASPTPSRAGKCRSGARDGERPAIACELQGCSGPALNTSLTRTVLRVLGSWTKQSSVPFVSPRAKSLASDPNVTKRPSAEIDGPAARSDELERLGPFAAVGAFIDRGSRLGSAHGVTRG